MFARLGRDRLGGGASPDRRADGAFVRAVLRDVQRLREACFEKVRHPYFNDVHLSFRIYRRASVFRRFKHVRDLDRIAETLVVVRGDRDLLDRASVLFLHGRVEESRAFACVHPRRRRTSRRFARRDRVLWGKPRDLEDHRDRLRRRRNLRLESSEEGKASPDAESCGRFGEKRADRRAAGRAAKRSLSESSDPASVNRGSRKPVFGHRFRNDRISIKKARFAVETRLFVCKRQTAANNPSFD